MGDDLTAHGKLRHRKVLYGRQKGLCKGCRLRPKWSKGHGESARSSRKAPPAKGAFLLLLDNEHRAPRAVDKVFDGKIGLCLVGSYGSRIFIPPGSGAMCHTPGF